jgi:4-amino-4-deoxy-L-arabinose transferase-like glycosyltransferase
MFLRTTRFLENRPLWTDEAKLALSVGRRGFFGLLQPLDYNQVAPVLYLWLLKAATSIFGMHEWALRLPSLVAGILMMVIVWLLAREVLSEIGALVALLLTATGPLLVAYAAEAKPYGIDALITAVLLLVALRVYSGDRKIPYWILGVCGVVAIGLSLPAVFVLGGISAAFLFVEWRDRYWTRLTTTLLWGALWLVLFLLQRYATYSDAATAKIMQDFWRGVMIRVGDAGWIGRSVNSVRSIVLTGTDPGWPFLRFFAPVGVVIATFAIWKRAGMFTALVLVLPPCLALVASALGIWPVDGRLALFLTPIAFVWLGAFAEFLWNTKWMQRGIRIAVAGFVILGAAHNVTRPSVFPPFEASRALISTLSTQRAHEPAYVFPGGVPAWVYYTTDWQHPDTARLGWYARTDPHRIAPGRHHAVMDTEPGLEWQGQDGLELVGRSTGMQFSMERGWVTPAPDPNWGNAEARRMMAGGSRQVWVYGSHVTDTQVDSLRDGIQRNNGEIVSESHGAFAVLWRVHFN